MNFQYIPPPDNPELLLDLAFKKARERSNSKKISGDYANKIRTKELIKLDVIVSTIVERLEKTIQAFPKTQDLPFFYTELMKLTLDPINLKYAIRGLELAKRQVKRIHKEYASGIATSSDRQFIETQSTQFYGRVSSIIKGTRGPLKTLDHYRKILRGYPDIKEMYTFCIYGFPNVGKSTLLNMIAKSKAKIAPYAFTTISINVGYTTVGEKRIQILDVPGTLNREKQNPVELQAELAVAEVASSIIYVFDLTDTSGYSLDDQIALYHKISNIKKTFVYISKKDITPKEDLKKFKIKHQEIDTILAEIAELAPLPVPEVEEIDESPSDDEDDEDNDNNEKDQSNEEIDSDEEDENDDNVVEDINIKKSKGKVTSLKNDKASTKNKNSSPNEEETIEPKDNAKKKRENKKKSTRALSKK